MARIIKRIFDFLAAGIGLIVLSPLLLIVAILIRLTMGRSVLFRQIRPGYKERPFTMFKFRTMREAFDKEGQPLPDAERLTTLGKFLRKTSLDELPELWNVVKGDMSLVGPRPLFKEYLPYYTDRERRRHEVRPGITGMAQIRGRNRLSWEERLELDVLYIESQSLRLDVVVLFQSIWKVIAGSDVIVPGTGIGKLSQHREKQQTAASRIGSIEAQR